MNKKKKRAIFTALLTAFALCVSGCTGRTNDNTPTAAPTSAPDSPQDKNTNLERYDATFYGIFDTETILLGYAKSEEEFTKVSEQI
ncbi:MAG: hypothetical protein K6B75_04875 [Lachnospiraceae bacterium]|nr:hypothetical protein [Lachnospiraceae bacterium]